MFARVAAWIFAAFLTVSPAAFGIETNTFADAPAAAAMPIETIHDQGQDQRQVQIEAKDQIKVQSEMQDQTLDNAQTKITAIDPGEPTIPAPTSAEPFSLTAAPVASGEILTKWRGVEANIRVDNEILARCRDGDEHCPTAAQNFLAIITQGRARTGRARVGVINRAINLAIAPMSDLAQWGVADRWSAPLETFSTGRGDCEDYAIAKYVALTAAGVDPADVKLVIVRNTAAGEDHAVVAVRLDGNWIMLDNRWLTLVADSEMSQVVPLFVLDSGGVRKFDLPVLIGAWQGSAPASL